MRLRDHRILVTGAGGFIGSHLAEALVRCGANVRAYVHYNALGRCGWLDESELRGEMEIIHGDICDAEHVRRAVDGVELVYHLAALIGIPYSYHAPQSYLRTNAEGTLNVLAAARQSNIRRVVHTSTSEVYGTARYAPIDEHHPLQAQSPYSASKIGADKLVESFHKSFGLPVVTLRPFNTFGPRQSLRAVIPSIISQCLAGSEICLGNVHTTRDFNYVSDTVAGFMLAGERSGIEGETINLGSGREIRIDQLGEMIANLLATPITIATEGVRTRPDASEVERLLADNGKARSLLGWNPQFTLEDGLRRTIEWFTARTRSGEKLQYAI